MSEEADTISILWSKDPRELSDTDIHAIVAKLREARTKWQQEEVSAKNQSRRVKPSQGINAEQLESLTLDQLSLGDSLDLSNLGKRK